MAKSQSEMRALSELIPPLRVSSSDCELGRTQFHFDYYTIAEIGTAEVCFGILYGEFEIRSFVCFVHRLLSTMECIHMCTKSVDYSVEDAYFWPCVFTLVVIYY